MLRIVVVTLLTLSLMAFQAAGVMAAANPDTGPGCGLGKLAWSGYGAQKSRAPQVFMATTNGTSGSQTFGISSGTSGCTSDGTIVAEHKVNVFAAINFENLSQEMAQGEGEHLASLATLMGVPAEHHAEFFALTQAKYTTLVRGEEAAPVAMVTALHNAMAAHPVLAKLSTNR